jgi:murein DD-endopeptidase MepM/ murein hydrolase activator NlpD
MPSLLKRYKRAEGLLFRKIHASISRGARGVLAAIARFIRGGSQSLSILVVSHSEEPPKGIRVSLFGLSGSVMLVAALVILVFAFSGSLGGARARVSESSAELVQAQDELEAVKAQTALLETAYKDFQSALGPIMESGGTHDARPVVKKASSPPMFAKRRTEAQSLAEIRAELDDSSPVIAEYGSMLGQMDSIKRTVPAIWPISGNIGHISTTFGTNPNPFTGQSYFHTGIDCSTYRSGDTLVATADGKVIFAGVEGGYGRCVIIAHAYGYITRMGHMDRLLVHSGQSVKQGQGVGILGNTGVSTAPHTHYEVIMGRGYLNPVDYLWSGARSFPIITGGGFTD